jgi:ribosome-binding factor A
MEQWNLNFLPKHHLPTKKNKDLLINPKIRQSSNAGFFYSLRDFACFPFMKHATAYTVRLGGGDTTEMLASLNANFDVFQRDIGHEIRMKFTPKVKFVEDNSFENATKIDAILHNLTNGEDES